MTLVDTHCHLDFRVFDSDRIQILEKCYKAGVKKLIIPGVLEKDWQTIVKLARQYANIYPALGLHPCFLEEVTSISFQNLERLLTCHENIVAVGETGLDFFTKNYDEARQREGFVAQIELAKTTKLPLILHVRKAHDQVIKLLNQTKFPWGGVVHCYSGSLQQAQRYLKLGFKLGIGGVVTYERSRRLRQISEELPLSAFVLETDAPDIPPYGQERTRNSPEFLPLIFDAFSRLRSEKRESIKRQLIVNTTEIFSKLRDKR